MWSRLIIFAVPCLLSTLLQLAFNAADTIIVGRYGSAEAMGAVGSTGALIHLQLHLMMGLSIGANVIAANFFGAKEWKRLHSTVLTSMVMAVFGGIILAIILIPCSRIFLQWMGTPDAIIDMAVTYTRIYLSSLPFILIYNFGSAILRAIGDTKRPMYFLAVCGVINVFCNIFFVVKLHMQADGVAWATFISQAISAALVWQTLRKSCETGGLRMRDLAIDSKIMKSILRVGIPTGLQSSCFGISNIMIQVAINSFGAMTVAGCAAASSIEGLTYSCSFAFQQVSVCFVGQNFGAKKYTRIQKGTLANFALVSILMLIVGCVTLFWGRDLLAIYNNNPEVIEVGMQRLIAVVSVYFFCGIMDTISGALRGMKYSMSAFILTLFFVCIFRIIWIYGCRLLHFDTIFDLMLCYPVSWFMASATMGTYMWYLLRKCIRSA